ncbi:MAG TPA: DUF3106 domain-containing protein [Candidatus Binatus sp.]|nr:DUF3106 domain-containing protein [Candidatus Binatus sp.]
MRFRLQLAGCLLAIGLSATQAGPSMAQHGRVAHWAPQQHTPPKSQPRPQQAPQQHTPPPRSQPRPQQAPQQHQPPKNAGNPSQQGNRPNGGGGNPPGNGANRPNFVPRPSLNPNNNPNRPPSSYTPPPRKFSDLPPQDRQRIIDNNNRYRNLPPAQRQELRDRAEQWNRMTSQQQSHIRNDVLPKWRQMPADRRQAIRQRLSVLQNMPESARNQRLNDPNFTRGMSEEDKATLRDLSHMHVGAPDPPNE